MLQMMSGSSLTSPPLFCVLCNVPAFPAIKKKTGAAMYCMVRTTLIDRITSVIQHFSADINLQGY